MHSKSAFTSSSFVLSAVTILGVVASALSGTGDPKLVAIGAVISAVYTACNAWLKVAAEQAAAHNVGAGTDVRLPPPSLPAAEPKAAAAESAAQ